MHARRDPSLLVTECPAGSLETQFSSSSEHPGVMVTCVGSRSHAPERGSPLCHSPDERHWESQVFSLSTLGSQTWIHLLRVIVSHLSDWGTSPYIVGCWEERDCMAGPQHSYGWDCHSLKIMFTSAWPRAVLAKPQSQRPNSICFPFTLLPPSLLLLQAHWHRTRGCESRVCPAPPPLLGVGVSLSLQAVGGSVKPHIPALLLFHCWTHSRTPQASGKEKP